MRVYGDGILSIGFGSNFNLDQPESEAGVALGSIPITDNLEHQMSAMASEGVYSDLGITTITDGQLVAQIDDISGNANHLTQSTTAQKITWAEDWNSTGYPAFWKDNTTQQDAYFDLTTTINFTSGEDRTMYVVFQKGATGSMTFYGGARSANPSGMLAWASGVTYFMANNYNFKSGGTSDYNTRKVRTFIVDNTAGNCRVYEDGSLLYTFSGVPNNSMTFDGFFNRGLLDADSTSAEDAWNESALYRSAHTTEQITEVTNYLKTKWGV
jgi:hypothetical protein